MKPKSPIAKQELSDDLSGQGIIGDFSSDVTGGDRPGDTIQVAPKRGTSQPRVFHIALRPTALSRYMDMVIDSMTPLNRRQSAVAAVRTPGSATMPAPPTPLSAVPQTPSFEKGPPPKRQKMKVESKDLLEYEARIVNSTAPPLYLDPAKSLEEVQAVLQMLKDPLHDEEPPSPKGRKRTVAELAADDALAKEQERFMLIMDERNGAGANTANASTVDGQAAAALFQPRFERFNALENIKAQHEENKRRELERKLHQDASRRAMQEQQQEEERRRAVDAQRHQEELRRRQAIMQNRQREQHAAAAAAAIAAGQPPNMAQANAMPPNLQSQILHASQAPRSSPVVRTSTPLINSSPVIGQSSQAGHNGTMGNTATSQGGAGSPPRPGSAVQHAHPGVAMVRGQSGQGSSRNGTPQIPQGTPSMRNVTPVMRQATPTQRMSQASPHSGMMAHTPQMQPIMMNGMQHMPNGGSNLNPMNAAQMAQVQAARQQQMLQQQAMLGQHVMPNGQHQISQVQATQMAHIQAQRQAFQEQQHAIQQQQHQMQQGSHSQQQQHPNQPNLGQPIFNTAEYQAQLRKLTQNQMHMSQQHQMQEVQGGSGSPRLHQATPQQQAAHLAHAQQQQQVAMQQHQSNHQIQNGLPPQIRGLPPQLQAQYQARFNAYRTNFMQQLMNSSPNGVLAPGAQERVMQKAKQMAMQGVNELVAQARAGRMPGTMAQQQQPQQQLLQQGQNPTQFTPQQYQQLQAQMQAHHQGHLINGLPGSGVLPK